MATIRTLSTTFSYSISGCLTGVTWENFSGSKDLHIRFTRKNRVITYNKQQFNSISELKKHIERDGDFQTCKLIIESVIISFEYCLNGGSERSILRYKDFKELP